MQASTVVNTGIEIPYETFGALGAPPLLGVMGLGAQAIPWHPELCAALVAANFFLVRFDNRDSGLSTHLHDAPPPGLTLRWLPTFLLPLTGLKTWPMTSLACSTHSG